MVLLKPYYKAVQGKSILVD